MNNLWRDLRFGFRLLRKNPGFAAVAVLALALGIGANTAIYSIVYATLLEPLPYHHPDEIVMVWSKIQGQRNGVAARRLPSTGSARARSFNDWWRALAPV